MSPTPAPLLTTISLLHRSPTSPYPLPTNARLATTPQPAIHTAFLALFITAAILAPLILYLAFYLEKRKRGKGEGDDGRVDTDFRKGGGVRFPMRVLRREGGGGGKGKERQGEGKEGTLEEV